MAAPSKSSTLLFVCSAFILGLGAALIWRHAAPPVELLTGTYLEHRRALPDFSLIDQRGQPFGPANLRGRWSMLFFGYTNCPDFCPTTLVTLAALEQQLRADGVRTRPQVVFVSVDAKRDTPQQLARYVPYFDPEFIGVTAANQAGIESLAGKLGVAVAIEPKADGTYTVDHSALLFVLDPDGRVAAILSGPFTLQALRADLQRIVAGHV